MTAPLLESVDEDLEATMRYDPAEHREFDGERFRVVQADGDLTGRIELAPDQAKRLVELLLKAAKEEALA